MRGSVDMFDMPPGLQTRKDKYSNVTVTTRMHLLLLMVNWATVIYVFNETLLQSPKGICFIGLNKIMSAILFCLSERRL